MDETSSVLIRIKNTVLSEEPEAKVILFGSYARGENKRDSDLDLVILIDKETISREDEKRIKYPLYDIEFETGQIISPMVYSKSDWESRQKITPFYKNVVSEGVEL